MGWSSLCLCQQCPCRCSPGSNLPLWLQWHNTDSRSACCPPGIPQQKPLLLCQSVFPSISFQVQLSDLNFNNVQIFLYSHLQTILRVLPQPHFQILTLGKCLFFNPYSSSSAISVKAVVCLTATCFIFFSGVLCCIFLSKSLGQFQGRKCSHCLHWNFVWHQKNCSVVCSDTFMPNVSASSPQICLVLKRHVICEAGGNGLKALVQQVFSAPYRFQCPACVIWSCHCYVHKRSLL